MEDIIRIEHVSKEYRLGSIGGGTLRGDLQSFMARVRGKEDPNTKIGQEVYTGNERFLALDDVSFSIKKGERVGIIGHNGAGKSTLLKLLSRVTAPTKGTISYNGRIASMLEVGTGFHPELTGRENVYLNGAILGMSKAEIAEKFDDIVRFAEMEKFIDTPVKRYSSGMYVKLAFAVAAHLDSDILVMDEVLAVGDMKFQQKCLGKMDDVSKSEGRTILYVSHNMNTVRQLCTRCIVMDHGKVVFDGDVEKGIEVYMNEVSHTFSTEIDLESIPRVWSATGTKIKMRSVSLLDDYGTQVPLGETVRFSIKLNSALRINDLCLRAQFFNNAGMPIGMMSTVSGSMPIQVGEQSYEGVLDTSQLASGVYWARFALYRTNEFGAEERFDVVDKAIWLAIQDGAAVNNLRWIHRTWGNVMLNNIVIQG